MNKRISLESGGKTQLPQLQPQLQGSAQGWKKAVMTKVDSRGGGDKSFSFEQGKGHSCHGREEATRHLPSPLALVKARLGSKDAQDAFPSETEGSATQPPYM